MNRPPKNDEARGRRASAPLFFVSVRTPNGRRVHGQYPSRHEAERITAELQADNVDACVTKVASYTKTRGDAP